FPLGGGATHGHVATRIRLCCGVRARAGAWRHRLGGSAVDARDREEARQADRRREDRLPTLRHDRRRREERRLRCRRRASVREGALQRREPGRAGRGHLRQPHSLPPVGKIDIIIATVTITDERRQVVEFSNPYFMSGSLLLVPKTSTVRGLEDVAGKTVAVVQGAIQDRDVAELVPKADRIKFGKVSEAVLAVKGGHADAY